MNAALQGLQEAGFIRYGQEHKQDGTFTRTNYKVLLGGEEDESAPDSRKLNAAADSPDSTFTATEKVCTKEETEDVLKEKTITTDPVERQKFYDEAQEIVYDDAPAVFLVLPEEAEGATAAVRNWEPASDSRVNLHDVCLEQ